MDDLKKGYREAEETTKETLRKADGEEDLGDKVANLGDDIKKNLGNLGDDIRSGAKDASEDMDRRVDTERDRY
jgi:hypothetical protein